MPGLRKGIPIYEELILGSWYHSVISKAASKVLILSSIT
jgi:hypothetical protein